MYRYFFNFKNILVTLILIFCANLLYSIDGASIKPSTDNLARHQILEAQIAYEEKDFGLAFKLAEIAKEQRKQEGNWAIYTLEEALRQPSALEVGSDIQTLLMFFNERQNLNVMYILQNVLSSYSIEEFNFSIENVLEYLRQTVSFPEADYLLGKLYMLEGELEVADLFFTDAYETRHLLDIPDVQYDILYSMADLYNLQGRENNYEEVLLLLAAENEKYYTAGEPSAFLRAILLAIENGMSADQFFLLYRDDYYKSIQAWFLLTEYFLELEVDDKALETAVLFSLAALTRIDEVLANRDMHYSYTSLKELFNKLKSFSDIASWASNNNVWEGFFLFAELCEKQGFTVFAQEIYYAIASECPERTWQILAQNALK